MTYKQLHFESPAELATLSRIAVPLAAGPSKVVQGLAFDDEDQGDPSALVATSKAMQTASKINQLQPGGPSITWPTSTSTLQATCAKPLLGKVFKGLAVGQAKLGIKMMDVRSSISLTPLTPDELNLTVSSAVVHTLQQKGWRCCNGLLVRHDFLAAAPGITVAAPAVSISCTAELPKNILLNVKTTETVSFTPFSILKALPGKHPLVAQYGDDDQKLLKDDEGLAAAGKVLQGRTCKIFIEAEHPLFIRKLETSLSDPELQQLRARWHVQHNITLPDHIPYFLKLSYDADGEFSQWVPSCCIWTSAGLTNLPPPIEGYIPPADIIKQLTDDITSSPYTFFSDRHLKVSSAKQQAAAVGASSQAGWGQASQVGWGSAKAGGSAKWTTAKKMSDIISSAADDISAIEAMLAEELFDFNPAAAAAADDAGAATQLCSSFIPDGDSSAYAADHEPALQDGQVWTAASSMPAPGKPAAPRRRREKGPPADYTLLKEYLASLDALDEQSKPAPKPKPEAPAPGASKAALLLAKPPAGKKPAAAGAAAGGASAAPKAPVLKSLNKVALAGVKPAAGAAAAKKPAAPKRKAPEAAVGPADPATAATTAAKPSKAPKAPKAEGSKPKKAKTTAAAAAAADAPAADTAPLQRPASMPAAPEDDDFEPAAPKPAVKPTAAAPAPNTAADASAAAAAPAAARKRTKASDLDLAAVVAKVQEKHSAGKLKDLSVPEMQCYLRSLKLAVGGKKADLEARVAQHLAGGGGGEA